MQTYPNKQLLFFKMFLKQPAIPPTPRLRAPLSLCRLAGWLAGWLAAQAQASLLSHRRRVCAPLSLSVGWLAGWLAGWLHKPKLACYPTDAASARPSLSL
jgi:hypothetical protein